MNVQLLMTGDELLSGDIIDSNATMMAKKLFELGLRVSKKITLGDDLKALTRQITESSHYADVLIINGGLGPTVDDLTAEALADAAKVPLAWHEEAKEHLNRWAEERNLPLSDANLKQAFLPEHCEVLSNPVGSAVGFCLTLNDCHILCTPGVPRELEAMLHSSVFEKLSEITPKNQAPLLKRFYVFGMGESNLQQQLANAFPDWPSEIALGFRADFPTLEVKLYAKSQADQELLIVWSKKLEHFLGAHILAKDLNKAPSLASLVQELLIQQNLKISTAESCTGGLIASLITSEAGSSQIFEAGFVTYSNEIKSHLVNVNEKNLQAYGAVSKQVVIEMAQGALSTAQADIAIAVSGVAGPGGGTDEKPVGTVWIAWGDKHKIEAHKFLIKGNRRYVQQATAFRALDLIRRKLLESKEIPEYMKIKC